MSDGAARAQDLRVGSGTLGCLPGGGGLGNVSDLPAVEGELRRNIARLGFAASRTA
jgi:hypothetical protein